MLTSSDSTSKVGFDFREPGVFGLQCACKALAYEPRGGGILFGFREAALGIEQAVDRADESGAKYISRLTYFSARGAKTFGFPSCHGSAFVPKFVVALVHVGELLLEGRSQRLNVDGWWRWPRIG
jgi:hypothetical protein